MAAAATFGAPRPVALPQRIMIDRLLWKKGFDTSVCRFPRGGHACDGT